MGGWGDYMEDLMVGRLYGRLMVGKLGGSVVWESCMGG